MKKIIFATSAAVLLASNALAQTAAPATAETTTAPVAATAPAPASPMSGEASGGMTIGTTSTVALKFVQITDADVMATKLNGLDVYNNQNDDIGEIQDLAIKDGKTISGVVVSVGGFLGLGERYVLLDPSSIVLSNQDGTMKAFVNTSKDELTKAPEFTYKK